MDAPTEDQLPPPPSQVALAHDAMAAEYDRLDDYWYPWLFLRIHEFIAEQLPPCATHRPRALDVGCGTGFQSFLLARAGFDVVGFDIASQLVDEAIRKSSTHARLPLDAPPLFSSRSWPDLASHDQCLSLRLERLRDGRSVNEPSFLVADATSFHYLEDQNDVVVCCGSVLSFIESYENVVHGIARSLRPGGRFILEVEQRLNPDLLWPILDNLTGGRLRYDQTWREIFSNLLLRPGRSVVVYYPFELHDGSEVILPIRLFTITELKRLFHEAGLVVRDRMAIHVLTNLLPSTLLHRTQISRPLRALALRLSIAESKVARVWPFWRLGCSVIYSLERRGPE